ncbi:SBBP repeat-containing protein [candidate division CSSED10-310 bacterium]|uniref:SBBP repeat-containing protein n=1 Tax=candidate division CSSED10-310 bacterium TaxID=2855610 RepID=A0ABV6YTN4_UNCC1
MKRSGWLHQSSLLAVILRHSIVILLGLIFTKQGYAHFNESLDVSRLQSIAVPFIENNGQVAPHVAYYARILNGIVFVSREGRLVYSLIRLESHEPDAGQKMKRLTFQEEFDNSLIGAVTGEKQAVTKVNIFKGQDPSQWRSSLNTYEIVDCGDVYPDIQLVLKACHRNVEKIFYAQPGSKPEDIRIRVKGAQELRVNQDGELEVVTSSGIVAFTKPLAYQEVSLNDQNYFTHNIDIDYVVDQDTYGFKIGAYDDRLTLIIDPLLASTFLGGSSLDGDNGNGVTVDGNGNVYVIGWVPSTDFPTTPGAYDTTHNGENDIFVSKLSSDLSTLISSTFLGGSDIDFGYVITLDQAGNVYITGATDSTDFPATTGAYDESHNGGTRDAYVAKLSNDLTSLLACSYLGGDNMDYGESLVLDGSNNVVIAGHTQSTDFPTTAGSYDESHNGSTDVFVLRINNSLSSLLNSTYAGGSSSDYANALTVDGDGNIYFTGSSSSSNFPTTPGAYDETKSIGKDVIIVKLSSDLTTLSASTFVGGNSADEGHAIAVDSNGNILVAGFTDTSGFPTTSGAYDESHNGSTDAFIIKMSNDLTTLSAGTFIGGSGIEYVKSIALDNNNNVYVSGNSSSSNYPTTSGAYDETYNSNTDIVISKLNNNLTTLEVSTYLGGSNTDYGYGLCLDTSNNVYVIGETTSTDFPTTPGAYDETHNGDFDVFVSKLNLGNPVPTFDNWAMVLVIMTITIILFRQRFKSESDRSNN